MDIIMTYKNDTPYPSVTEIISPYIDKRWYSKESQIKGTTIHACCDNYLNGLYYPKLKPEYELYMDSFKRWADKNIIKVIKTEERLIDKDLGYCGKPDIVAELINNELPAVIDIKTGQSLQKSWKLQIPAYAALEAKCNDLFIDVYRCISLRLKSNGKGCLAVEYNDVKENFNIFVGLVKAHYFFYKTKGAL